MIKAWVTCATFAADASDAYHPVNCMFFVVSCLPPHRPGASCKIHVGNASYRRPPAVLSIMSAVYRRRAALDIVFRPRRAGVMQATVVANVRHAVLSILLTVCRSLAALHIKVSMSHARVVRVTIAPGAEHAVHSMLLAVNRRLTAIDTRAWMHHARPM